MQRMSRESDFARAELEHLAAGEPSAFIALAPGRRAAASVPTRSTSALRLASGLRPLPSGSGRPSPVLAQARMAWTTSSPPRELMRAAHAGAGPLAPQSSSGSDVHTTRSPTGTACIAAARVPDACDQVSAMAAHITI